MKTDARLRNDATPAACAIIAHRGAPQRAPENTLASIRLAWDIGSDAVEVDIHLSRDGRIVVMHDETTGRTTDADHTIAERTAAELQRLNAAAHHSASHPFEKVPLLSEVFATVPAGGRVVIEIKDNRPELLEALKSDIQASGLSASQIVLGTFDYDFAVKTKRHLPDHAVAWINAHYHNTPVEEWEDLTGALIARLREGGLDGMTTGVCHAYDPLVFLPHLRRIQSAGLRLYVWTVDDIEKARALWELPVDGIITNVPDVLLEARAVL